MLGVTSVRASRRRLSYETWYFLHLYAYLAIALAFLHQLFAGADFIHDQLAAIYWISLYVLTAALVLVFRVGQPVATSLRHRLRVSAVVPEAPGVASIYLAGRDLDRLPVRSGQYFVVRFLTRDGWWRGHPYSLSSAPNGSWLRITVKALGDDSSRMQRIPVGTAVFVEGPYGVMTGARRSRRKVTLIAGGIGIAPLRALMESLAARPGDLTLLYRVRNESDIVFRRELDLLAAAPRGRRPLPARKADGRPGDQPDRPGDHRPPRPGHRRAGRLRLRARGHDAGRGGKPPRARRAGQPGPRGAVRVLTAGAASQAVLSEPCQPRQHAHRSRFQENHLMPKRGAFALGLTALALVLLLNFQAPSLSPASATGTGGGTGTGGTGVGTTRANGSGSSGTAGGNRPGATQAPVAGTPAPVAGTRTVDGPVVNTRFGSVQVEVTLDGTRIVDVAALRLPSGDRRTDQISSYVEPILRTQALQAQSATIDGISGATYTSNGYARSLQAALDSAGI